MSNITPVNEYVVDTVALILRLESRQMGAQARQCFIDMEQGTGDFMYQPSFLLKFFTWLSVNGLRQPLLLHVLT